MSIQNTRRVCGPYACNGLTTQFPFDFKVFEAEQVAVQVGDALDRAKSLTFGADYSVALNDDQDAHPGGTVTLHTAYAKEYRVAVISNVPNVQPDTLINLGGFYPKVIERALDRLEAQIQQVDSVAQRSVRVPVFSNTKPYDLWDELKADTRAAKQARDEAHGWADSALSHSRGAAASQQTAGNAAERAADALSAAEMFANNASNSERSAISYAASASVSAGAAKASADSALASAAAANKSETDAKAWMDYGKSRAYELNDMALKAVESASSATYSAGAAKASETAAASSATQAKASETAAMRANEAIAEANAKVEAKVEAKFATLDSGITAVGNGLTGAWQNVAMAMGPGQRLVDVTASRALGVQYINSSGRPIVVYARVAPVAATGRSRLHLQIGSPGRNVDSRLAESESAGGDWLTVSAVIPPGEAYMVHSPNSVSLNLWREYQ